MLNKIIYLPPANQRCPNKVGTSNSVNLHEGFMRIISFVELTTSNLFGHLHRKETTGQTFHFPSWIIPVSLMRWFWKLNIVNFIINKAKVIDFSIFIIYLARVFKMMFPSRTSVVYTKGRFGNTLKTFLIVARFDWLFSAIFWPSVIISLWFIFNFFAGPHFFVKNDYFWLIL